jgi:large subunit ribosomal protein L3
MPGQMGAETVTTQNLKIVAVYPEDGIIIVQGNVPGNAKSWVVVHDAVKKAAPADAPKPAGLKSAAAASAALQKLLQLKKRKNRRGNDEGRY